MCFRLFLFFILFIPYLGHAAARSINRGTLVGKELAYHSSVQEEFGKLLKACEEKKWAELITESKRLIADFAKTSFAHEALYYLGVGYFNEEDFELANKHFTTYLTGQTSPTYFEQAIEYKLEIAEKFRLGAKKHLMGLKKMPKWTPARSDAIAIYEEVISALPHHDLAARALYGKAFVLSKTEDFRAGVETYQTLIRRFPKHPLAVESYIGIGEIYLSQSKREYPDPDFMDLAELNMRKFRSSFPGEEKLLVAELSLNRMREYYAYTLFETARFYERTGKWGAAKIYYEKILKSYPNTQIAQNCPSRLASAEAKLAKGAGVKEPPLKK